MGVVRRIIRKLSGLKCIEDLTVDQRREMWPLMKQLVHKHIQNCRMVENRIKLFECTPKNAACAEVGIYKYAYSEAMLEVTRPKKLHLVDNENI